MKANRKFVNDVEAVSPVIAVILMVAITVVLAATVFVLVSDIGSNTSKTQPAVSWRDDEVADNWRVDQAPQQVKWDAYKIKSDKPGVEARFPGSASGSAGRVAFTTTNQGTYVGTNSLTTMNGGDVVQFCSTASTATTPSAVPSVTFTLLHIASNAVAHQYTFLDVAAVCS